MSFNFVGVGNTAPKNVRCIFLSSLNIQAVKVSDKNLAGLVPSPELQEW